MLNRSPICCCCIGALQRCVERFDVRRAARPKYGNQPGYHIMNRTSVSKRPARRRCSSRRSAGILFMASSLMAQSVQHLGATQPGGMPGLPVMGGIERLTNGVQVTWDGPSGYYQLYQKSNSLTAPWVALGKATNLVRNAVITKLYSNAFFRVSGPAPKYAGTKVCLTCHLSICQYETNTPHAGAFSSPAFMAAGGQTNGSCLPCHTVGYGLPTGFSFTNRNGAFSYTTNLAGVQCENCHGPAANHAAATDDPTAVPRVELAATVCGGCHSASHTAFTNAPTFEEWTSSGHAAVVPDALSVMSASTNNISSCGRCHSGSVRLALINGQNPVTLTNDLAVAITCAVCHDPHQTNANPAQLRNPSFSTNYFSLSHLGRVHEQIQREHEHQSLRPVPQRSRGRVDGHLPRPAPFAAIQFPARLRRRIVAGSGRPGQLQSGFARGAARFRPDFHFRHVLPDQPMRVLPHAR